MVCSASIAVPSAEPESFGHGGTKTEENCPDWRHCAFHSQLRPQPPAIRSGIPSGRCCSAASWKVWNIRVLSAAAAVVAAGEVTPAL